MSKMGFQENLKEAMYIQDCTTKELSVRTGISVDTISSYLKKNGSIPTADKAVRIAEALQVTVEFLVNGFNSPAIPLAPKASVQPAPDPLMKELASRMSAFSRADVQVVKAVVKALSEKYEAV